MTPGRARGWAVVIVLFYLIVLLAGHGSIGLTDDDDFYVPAGISYVDWVGKALTFQKGAWTRASIDAAFTVNKEHPPFAKYVFGVCRYLFSRLGPTDGARIGTVLFSTLAAAMLLLLSLAHLGPGRGLFVGGLAVGFLLFLPRFYFHSHAATLDVPVAAMYVATASFALLAERSTKAALWTGVLFGLACATKLNAPFLIVPYGIFALLVRRGRARHQADRPQWSMSLRLPPVPLAFLAMVVIGPLVFFALWPWLWSDTFRRLGEYIGFHFNHYGIYFLYFGHLYDKAPFAPWHAPFVMAAITVPLATSALALLGIGFARTPILSRLRNTEGPDDEVRREGDLLLTALLHAVISIAVVAFSGGPKYGGAKLFMPFYPFWCLLAGYGAVRLFERFRSEVGNRWAPSVVVGTALASALALQLRFGGYALSEYNGLAGGLRGATALGFERQFYDIAFRDLVAWLNEHAPEGARVHFLPNNWEYVRTYKWYKTAGELRPDINVVSSEHQAQWIVLTHERRFLRYGNDLERYRNRKVLEEKMVDGTPIWSVVEARPSSP